MAMGIILLFATVLGLLGQHITLIDKRKEEYQKYQNILDQFDILNYTNDAGKLVYEKLSRKLEKTNWKYFKNDVSGLKVLVKMNLDYIHRKAKSKSIK